MDIKIVESTSKLTYEIRCDTKKYHSALTGNHYALSDGVYKKSFDLPIENTDVTIQNFRLCAKTMFDDIAKKKPMKWRKGLYCFSQIAQENNIDWWTNGKAALNILGVDIEVDDLDFVFDIKDMDKVNHAFRDYIIEPICTTRGTFRESAVSYYGVAYSHCRTCFMVDPLDKMDIPNPVFFGKYAREHLETVNFMGLDIQVAPLWLHLDTYKNWGKTEYVEIIEKFQEANQSTS